MNKKLLSVLMCLVLLVTSYSVVSAEEAGAKTYTLTLDQAIQIALDNDPTYKNFSSAETNAQKQVDKALSDQKDLEGTAIYLPSGLANVAVKQGYYVEQAKIGQETVRLSKKQYEYKTSYLVTQAYFGVKVAEDIVETSYSAFKLASNNLTNVNLQFSLGMVSALDVSNATYAKNEAEAQYNKSVRDLDLAVKSFAAKLFVNSKNSKFVLTDEIVYEDFNAVFETDTEKAINNRLDLYQLKSVYLQADRYTKVTILVGPTSAQHSDANQAKSTAEVNYNNAVTQTSLYINSVYNSVLDADDALSLAGENYSLRQKEYEIATLQYDLGMITNTQLVTYMNIATSAKLNLDNAKLTYLLAMKKYNYEIEIGLGL